MLRLSVEESPIGLDGRDPDFRDIVLEDTFLESIVDTRGEKPKVPDSFQVHQDLGHSICIVRLPELCGSQKA
jgi:hypothetical protein